MPKPVDIHELRRLLYQEKRRPVAVRLSVDPNQREVCTFTLRDPSGADTEFETTDEKAIEHMLRFKKTQDPSRGPQLAKVRDFDKHWEAWDEVTKVTPQEIKGARQALLSGERKVDFDWASLLHDALGGADNAFHSRFLPLRTRHVDLMAHLEIIGYKCVKRGEKMAKSQEHAEANQLVQDSQGYVETPDGFLPRLLDIPGGPAAYEAYISDHLATAHSVIDTLADKPDGGGRPRLYAGLATYATMLEALRIPLLILAKSLERKQASPKGNTEGRLTDLVEFLTSHPQVGAQYEGFLDSELRHCFAHASFRLTDSGVALTSDTDLGQTIRDVSPEELFDRLGNLVIRFAPAAVNGALMAYYLDARLMMQSAPYAEWLVGIGNTQK